MNLKNSVFLVILLIGFNSLNAQTWTTKQVGISNTFMQRMWFTGSTTGYATSGDNTGGTGSVLKTTNAGLTWTKYVTTCTNATYDVNFLNANTGFTCSFNGEISRSTNAGVNWTTVYANGSSNYLYTMGFLNANTGFAGGFSYTVRTTNGGTNWTESSLSGFQYSNSVLSSTKAIMCGSQTGSDGGVWTSTDAGASWNYVQVTASNILYDIYFVDANTGYVVGGGGLAYKTTNGGTSWGSALTTGSTNTFQCVYFQNANTGFIAGSGGSVYRTTNGGTNFTQCTTIPNISGQTQYDIAFLDANNAIMSGSQGALFKTTDEGLNWTTVGNNQQLNAITFVDASTGYVAGNSSSFQKTTDGGNTWQVYQSFSGAITSNAVEFIDASTGYIAGNTGNLIKTTNGGVNWTALTPGVATNILSLKFLDANTGYYGTTAGGVRITTNGGANWTALTTGAATNITSLSFPSANTGYLCSTGGIVRKTTNAGTNWTLLTTKITANLNSIYFLDDNTGWAVGASGKTIRTTNGGSVWDTTTTPGSTQALNSVRFGSVNQGIAVGNTGTIMVTNNGGVNWSAQTSGTTANLRSVYIGQLGTSLFVSGANGTILNSTDQVLPVELSFFNSSVTGRNVKLSWGTILEQNNSGFTIERKNSGGVWNDIGFVNGIATTNQQQSYSFDDRNLSSGKYSYRLKQIDFNGNYKYYNLSSEVIVGKPSSFALMQNYPNPFNPSTKISFEIPLDGMVSLKIYDVTGKEVMTLLEGYKTADYYTVNFDAKTLTSGIYFCKLAIQNESRNFVKTIKMVLSK
ncbi:MAG: T9SS type A sorting domain-containing protein [Bacteroidetes bacterium]|nr:T9SS type A sorting domain-containing protein [Bacteroidota bacterium]